MPITFDEVNASVSPPPPTAVGGEDRESREARPDEKCIEHELHRLRERRQRLVAD